MPEMRATGRKPALDVQLNPSLGGNPVGCPSLSWKTIPTVAPNRRSLVLCRPCRGRQEACAVTTGSGSGSTRQAERRSWSDSVRLYFPPQQIYAGDSGYTYPGGALRRAGRKELACSRLFLSWSLPRSDLSTMPRSACHDRCRLATPRLHPARDDGSWGWWPGEARSEILT